MACKHSFRKIKKIMWSLALLVSMSPLSLMCMARSYGFENNQPAKPSKKEKNTAPKQDVLSSSGLGTALASLRESVSSPASSLDGSYMSEDEGYEPSPRTSVIEECLVAIKENNPKDLRETLNETRIHPDTIYGWLKLSLFQAHRDLMDSIRIKKNLSPGSLDATNADQILTLLLAQAAILEKKK